MYHQKILNAAHYESSDFLGQRFCYVCTKKDDDSSLGGIGRYYSVINSI